ncbi:hypothetical protein MTX20_05000 [Bradyrhizobium sp. ISRA435]|nr:hypothetical protein MTX20_05000 [Bradyrhizobium sp. ISRA435]
MQHQIARDFEHHVTEEEDAGREAEDRGAETEVLVHGQSGVAEIDAVEIVEEHHHEQDWDQPPVDAADRLLLQFTWRRVGH